MGRKRWPIVAVAIAILLLAGAIAVAWINPRLTRYIESDQFRVELEKATAKGLHFPSGQYSSIKRTGLLTAASDRFHAENGHKALNLIDARGIAARFNPLAVFLQRWQLDEVHIDSGEVDIQTYTPIPEPTPTKSWLHVFLPERVYLKRVWSEPADVTWGLRGKKCGLFGTRLLITPHGRDFEYQATGGTTKMPVMPEMQLRHTHLLVTKTWLSLYDFDLAANEKSDGTIHAEGTAGTGEDRRVDFTIDFNKLPIGEWLPASWKGHCSGAATGKVHWTGKNPKLEDASVRGSLRVHEGRVAGLPFLENLATITKKKSIAHLELKECSAEIDANHAEIDIRKIDIEDTGKFRIEGEMTIHEKILSGAIRLGVARQYLEWLPHPEEIFPRQSGGYLWTRVHLSGTTRDPQQDLSPRIVEVLKESPTAFLGLIFRQLDDAITRAFGGK
ncbi:MAG: hypothetical protein DME49_13355 [Verrucomicrobia bacterium]|nr:MAG: hypothetical protein DME49_13355 [Verrucomicrobiota bacterium]PYK93327.1 MAG: hypothetical protein DME36_09850 [Verrucomicrobiota bacterium]PYL38143.1 MAG: hypothetical protein DMF34_07810 [Verrucomicrobiota bacterium]